MIQVDNLRYICDPNAFQGLLDALLRFLDVLETINFDLLELPNDWREYVVHYGEEVGGSSEDDHVSGDVHEDIPQHFQKNSIPRQDIALIEKYGNRTGNLVVDSLQIVFKRSFGHAA